MSVKEKVLSSIRREPILELLKKLISIPSIMGEEHEIAEYVMNWFSDLGFETQSIPIPNCGPTVIAKLENPEFLYYGHLDTVPVCDGWTRDPFNPVVEGDFLYGLGAFDMLGGLTALMIAAKALKEAGVEKGLMVVAASDEEGFSRGAYTIIQKGLLRGIESAICGEPTGLDRIEIGRRGRYVLNINVKGLSAHGAMPEMGINAIEEASKIITSLKDLKLKMALHPRMHEGSITTLGIEGGTPALSVPDKCSFIVDRHVVPGETKEKVMEDFEELIKKLKLRAEVEIEWYKRPTPFLESYEISVEEEVVKNILKIIEKEIGTRPQISYGMSVADENYLVNLASIPTVTYGPDGGNSHSPDEFCDLNSVITCSRVYASTFLSSYFRSSFTRL